MSIERRLLMDDFDLEIYFGKLVKKRYARLYSQGNGEFEPFIRKLALKYMWEVEPWLKKEFPNEAIEDGNYLYCPGQRVLIVSLSISDEFYFLDNGKLAEIYRKGETTALVDRFIKEVDAGFINPLIAKEIKN
jgi:hypothetical protein